MDNTAQSQRWPVLWMALAVAFSRGMNILTGHIFDDSYITFRYATNVAEGNGFVYNLGERVQGITTPLWGFILALLHAAGLDLEMASRILGGLLDVVTVILVMRILLRENHRLAAYVTAFLFALDPTISMASIGGMENSLFLLATVLAVVLLLGRRPIWAGLVAGLSYFIRPEGLLFAFALLFFEILRSRSFPWKPLLAGAAIMVAGVLVQYAYFGDVIPQSVRGKAAVAGSLNSFFTLIVFSKTTPLLSLLTLTTVLGIPWALRLSPFARAYGLWVLVLILVWIVTECELWIWYCTPVWFFKTLVTGVAADTLISKSRVLEWVRRLAVPWLLLLVVMAAWTTLIIRAEPNPIWNRVFRKMKEWGQQHNLRGQTVCALDFGAFGYYTGARIVDMPGLVTPASLKEWHSDLHQIILHERPDWVLVTMRRSDYSVMVLPDIQRLYAPVIRFSVHGDTCLNPVLGEVQKGWSHDFLLFKRVAAKSPAADADVERGKRLFPFRTEKLSPESPMVLAGQLAGRVGR